MLVEEDDDNFEILKQYSNRLQKENENLDSLSNEEILELLIIKNNQNDKRERI